VNDARSSVAPPELGTIFLDRDGVLNKKMPDGSYVRSAAEFHPLPGVAEAIGQLNRAGKRVLVVSNQRGIALGLYTAANVEAIHGTLQSWLGTFGAHVDRFYFCPHDKDQCHCRKPLPGMFDQAIADFPEITAASSAMIGDSLSDIEFGHRLGMRTVFVAGGTEQRKKGAEEARALADLQCGSLLEAVDALLA
jgi:D-glycero-D-manno-heptose 1,7-bisphosphate phosphatase